ncbi:MAG: UV DNA damage repair endonuclease UvsE [Candidatus Erginobacter occultus]|nr:UV DNA damage repair endonuclease UvsE [Candidatus Erginobacter occultus]
MRIGYPCLNRTLECRSSRTFRLKSYSEERLVETVENNLDCLFQILRFNVEHNILFFRITSDLVPFASHPVCRFDWGEHFRQEFSRIGRFINKHKIRISMHPDQFTLINSLKVEIFERSRRELLYHGRVLDLLGLNHTAKIQIHVGGVYGDKPAAIARFIARYQTLEEETRRRLVIENDDVSYTLADCLKISAATGIPVLFDVFHHSVNCSGEPVPEAVRRAAGTWKKRDGILMTDYSSQKPGAARGSHTETIEIRDFKKFLAASAPVDFDVLLEIKDKEKSAQKAAAAAASDPRFYPPAAFAQARKRRGAGPR